MYLKATDALPDCDWLDADDMAELVARIHDILACPGIDPTGLPAGPVAAVELALILLRLDMVQMCGWQETLEGADLPVIAHE